MTDRDTHMAEYMEALAEFVDARVHYATSDFTSKDYWKGQAAKAHERLSLALCMLVPPEVGE